MNDNLILQKIEKKKNFCFCNEVLATSNNVIDELNRVIIQLNDTSNVKIKIIILIFYLKNAQHSTKKFNLNVVLIEMQTSYKL